ncbi:hypothetical protein V6N11_006104 [Hibiscus sabdariffa]|uniref:RanBP2-type domain-containing protein n=1 Tax=Hibiscus sabdariffa TaxID=183260 RepID=A0ABR2RQ34_9ROSI
MSRPGDWNCRSCQHLNFQRRDNCQRCGESRSGDHFGGYGVRGGSTFGFTMAGSDVRPGDWYCNAGNCGTHNFASRSTCFNCGVCKDDSAGGFDFDISRSRGFGGNRSGAVPQGTSATELHIKTHAKVRSIFWVFQGNLNERN